MFIAASLLLALSQSAPVPPAAAPATPAAAPATPPVAPTPPAAPGVPGVMTPSASPAADILGKPGIAGLVAPDARPEVIIKGLQFGEGPASDAYGETYFCDISAVRVYRIARDTKGYRADVVLEDTKGCSGLAFSRDGRLYATQMYTGRICEVLLSTDGTGELKGVIESYHGELRPNVNDIAVGTDGGMWFTNMGERRRPERHGIYYSTTAGAEPIQFPVPEIDRPNGIRLSPDGKTLYVADYGKPVVWAYPVEGPAKLGTGRVFASLAILNDPKRITGGDGLTVDSMGNVWVAVPSATAVLVFDPQGKPLGRVMFPEPVSNCAFGGADGRTLYITGRTSVFLLPTIVPGYWPARGGSPTVQVPPAPVAPSEPAKPVAPAAPAGK
jgi:gluconolactonase